MVEENKYIFFTYLKDNVLYRGDTSYYNKEIILNDITYFALNEHDAEIYGLVYIFKLKRDVQLLEINYHNIDIIYKNAPYDIKEIIKEIYVSFSK